MSIKVGDAIPNVKISKMGEKGPEPVETGALFNVGRAVLFAVPGAFTPTCSARHLPGFVDKADEIKAKGVDLLACISVNDAFVMGAWGKAHDAGGKVVMLADGNGDFTKAMGRDFDGSGFGMGRRSQRYALIAEKGKVTHLFVEEPGKFEVSAAEYVLKNL
ncbi:MAG: peroxiredoxin [Alphaproteobacteria bacterium]|nr:peroxiredoxin [Alphaproteobacteria bacterium]